jgi:hypothetical protein
MHLTSTRAERVISIGVLTTLATVIAQTASQSIDFGVFGLGLRFLDSNHHRSIFGAASLLAQAAAVAAIAARSAWAPRRAGWLLLAALVGVLLILRIINAYDVPPLLPLVAVIVLLFWRLTSDDPTRPRAIIWGALLLLGLSFGLHAVVPRVDSLGSAGNSWAFQIKSMLKHSAELAGWMLLATGVAAASRRGLQSRDGRSDDRCRPLRSAAQQDQGAPDRTSLSPWPRTSRDPAP